MKVFVVAVQTCVFAQSLQLCLPLCSPPGSSVHEILQPTGVGCQALLQGLFLTQASNPHLMSSALAGELLGSPNSRPLNGALELTEACPTQFSVKKPALAIVK